VNAPAAWDTTTGAGTTVIAVLDTGVNSDHPDLAGRLTAGYDFVNSDPDPVDDNGHGTQTTGVVGAAANNATGIAGLCWSCTLMPVKVADASGSVSWSNLASGITWATDHGASVISMSISGSSSSTTLANAVSYAHDHGVVLVAAAGNNGSSTVTYPAGYPQVIGVAGTTGSDTLYSWSNYGSWVKLAAPGCDYTTTMAGSYASFCGTSAATPVVSGVVGLLRSAKPAAGTAEIEGALLSASTPIGPVVSAGRIDAAASLAALGATASTPAPTEPPSPSPSPSPAPVASATPAPSASATPSPIDAPTSSPSPTAPSKRRPSKH
jgi:subtilisin family serine protease